MQTRLALIHELHALTLADQRCPHLQHDAGGCRCRRVAATFAQEEGLSLAEADQAAQLVCDTASLQLWCLAGPERWPACIYFGAR